MDIGARLARELVAFPGATSSRGDIRMKLKEITPEQSSSVPCPTCGVSAGEPCVLYSGALRSEPHIDRKFAAAEAIERH